MRAWLAALSIFGLMATPLPASSRKLVVISIGGLDYRYLRDADKLHLKIPVLRRLMASGAVADGVVGVAPGDGWPAATSLVTGVEPWRHGVLAEGQASRISTLWEAASRAHLKTALLYWPASAGAQANFVCPEVPDPPHAGAVPFEPIAAKCTPGFVERVGGVYSRFTKSIWNDETSFDALNYLLDMEQPDLTLVHLADLDAEEHETGALSLYSREVLENDDELLGAVLKKLPPRTILAIVSDHGFETEDHVVRPRVLVDSPAVEVRNGLIGTADRRVAAALQRASQNRKNGIAREVPMAEVKQFCPELTTWVAAFGTLPGYVALEEGKGPAVGLGNRKGVHGLWPTRPNYRSAFIVWGDEVKPGRLGEISLLEIAPTLASIVEVKLPEAKQASLWPKIGGRKKK